MLHKLQEIARKAGQAIMEIYESDDFNIEAKGDGSPLTRADQAAHNVIVAGLEKHFPEIPILSEEGKDIRNQKTLESILFSGSTRWNQRIHQTQRRIHRQHCTH